MHHFQIDPDLYFNFCMKIFCFHTIMTLLHKNQALISSVIISNRNKVLSSDKRKIAILLLSGDFHSCACNGVEMLIVTARCAIDKSPYLVIYCYTCLGYCCLGTRTETHQGHVYLTSLIL